MTINNPPRNAFYPFFVLLAPLLGMALYISAGMLASETIREANQVTIENVAVTEPNGLSAVWTLPTPAHSSSRFLYRPVLAQLLRMEFQTWGDSPSSYHSVSLFLFCGVILMFILLLGRLTEHPGARVAAALTLALHPLFTQAVQNVAAQGVLLSLLASLAACYAFLHWREGTLSLAQGAIAVGVAGFIAIGSCEMGLLLPVWLLAAALLKGWRTSSNAPLAASDQPHKTKSQRDGADASALQPPASGLYRPILAFGLPLLVIASLYVYMRHRALGALMPPPLEGLGGAIKAPRVLGAYLARLLWPASPTYFYTFADSWKLTPVAPVAWAMLAGLIAALVWAWRRWPLLALGLVFLLTSLIAISHVMPLTFFMSEQPLPFALVGLALIVGAVVGRLTSPLWSLPPERVRDRVVVGLLCLAWLAMGWQSWARSREWSKTETLWQTEAKRHPASAAPLIEMMDDSVRQGRPEAARNAARAARKVARPAELARIIELEAATAAIQRDDERLKQLIDETLAETRPIRPEHLERIAYYAYDRDFKQEYSQLLEKQAKFYPNSFEALYGLAKLELDAGNIPKAIEWGSKAIQFAQDPISRAMGLERYGIILARAGRLNEAEMELNQALAIDKTRYEAYIHLARIYWGKKDYEKAKGVVRAAYANAAGRVTSLSDLVEIYTGILESEGHGREAVDWMEQQMNQFPRDVRMQVWGARYLIEFGRYERAARAYEALAQMPEARGSAVDILVGMGLVKARGERDKVAAAKFWREALKRDPLNLEAKRFLAALDTGSAAGIPNKQ